MQIWFDVGFDEAMKTFLVTAALGIVLVLWLCLKYWQAKNLYTRDLGDGGVQKLLDESKKKR